MELVLQNTWWKGREYIQQDKQIVDFEAKKFKWHPKLLKDLKLIPNNIFTLRGPRQIGKSTLTKIIIRDLLNKGVKEEAIFYWSCDQIVNQKELTELLEEYLSFSESLDIKEKYIFLDEISTIKNWQKTIKLLVDIGRLNGCCLFLTGSHILDIKHGTEKMPGRRGKYGKDILLLPMTFREFMNLINPNLHSKIKAISTLSLVDIKSKSDKLKAFNHELKTLFNQYLITGGFPLVVNEFMENKKIADYIPELYLKWVTGDIVKWGKQEKILMQLIRVVISKLCSAISWDSLAKESEIKSHKTISAYIEDLENMFVLTVLYFLDRAKRIADFNKNKKIYFLDPFIYHIFNNKLLYENFKVSSSLIESVAVAHLARFSTRDSLNLNQSIFYWRNKREVDILIKSKDKIFPIEVKYQTKINNDDWKSLYPFSTGILITKDYFEFKKRKYLALPVHIFLALLDIPS